MQFPQGSFSKMSAQVGVVRSRSAKIFAETKILPVVRAAQQGNLNYIDSSCQSIFVNQTEDFFQVTTETGTYSIVLADNVEISGVKYNESICELDYDKQRISYIECVAEEANGGVEKTTFQMEYSNYEGIPLHYNLIKCPSQIQ